MWKVCISVLSQARRVPVPGNPANKSPADAIPVMPQGLRPSSNFPGLTQEQGREDLVRAGAQPVKQPMDCRTLQTLAPTGSAVHGVTFQLPS